MSGRRQTEELTREIEALLSDTATRLSGIELVAVELSREGRRTVVRVFIDREGSLPPRPRAVRLAPFREPAAPAPAGKRGPEGKGRPAPELPAGAEGEGDVPAATGSGVSHEDCARVTRLLGDHLDSDPRLAPLVEALGAYVLEVSSPGIERPLRTPAHFDRFRGEEASITTTEKILGCLEHLSGEILVEEQTANRARGAIERMLQVVPKGAR